MRLFREIPTERISGSGGRFTICAVRVQMTLGRRNDD